MMMGGGMRGEDPDVDMRLEEEKIDMRGSANMHLGGMMNKLPGQNEYEIMESYRKQEEYEKCIVCKKSFTKEDEVKENKLIIWSTDCLHMTHKKCFLAHLF
jgi:alpha-D-ribose 1-methylphosphonate 5-triphosphate diphosphatase PhnM